MKPLVSVLMTSYNRCRYIGAAIESVLASTYADFELIIVDDCSTDDTMAVAKKYANSDNRIKVYVNESNLGDYPNRNKAAKLARGKYLKYVDADDYIYPWGLEIMVNSMEQYPEAGWGLCSLSQDKLSPFPFMLQPNEIFEYHNFKSSLFHKAPLSAIIKKEVFDKVGGFSGKRQMSDVEMWHILSMKFPAVLMPHGIVWYREHENQESAQARNEIIVRARYLVATIHFYENNLDIPMEHNQRMKVVRKLKKQILLSLIKNFLKGRWKWTIDVYRSYTTTEFDFTVPY